MTAPPENSQNLIVVVVNYNFPDDTIECIRSVQKSDYQPFSILLIDNGSQDNSVEVISAALPEIPIIRLEQNQGFTGGYNFGIQQALARQASHVFLLSNDTVVDPTTITALMQSDWDVAIPKILYYSQPDTIQAAGSRWRRFPPTILIDGMGEKDGPEFDQPKQLTYATGCAMLLKRAVLERVHGFDPDYVTYWEDYDFCYRINAAGFKIGYVPTARLLHKLSLTTEKNPPLRRWFMGRNSVLFFRTEQRFPFWQPWLWIFLASLRQTLNGNIAGLPDYWKGFIEGYKTLKRRNKLGKPENDTPQKPVW